MHSQPVRAPCNVAAMRCWVNLRWPIFQDLRVEHAQSLLRGNDVDIEVVAGEVGYADGATLRTLLRERLGRGVRDLRQICAEVPRNHT